MSRLRSERGVALIASLMAMTILMAFGTALIVITSTESLIAGNFVSGRETIYAAEAIVELVVAELRTGVNWSAVLDGTQPSRFVDGAPHGVRVRPPDAPLDLTAVLNLANCATLSPCAGSAPWRLFAYGSLGHFLPVAGSPFYVVALVAPAQADSAGLAVRVRGEAFGPRGAHRALETTVMATAEGPVHTAAAALVP